MGYFRLPKNYDDLASFIALAKVQYKIPSVSAVHSYQKGFADSTINNSGRTSASEKLDGSTIENEWMQTDLECDFECTKALISFKSDSKLEQSNPLFNNEVYIGWLNSTFNEEKEDEYLVQNLDRILVNCYRSKPDFDYCEGRLVALAKAEKTLS